MDSKIAGCLFGMAYGDALGAETEFLDMQSILCRFPNGLIGPETAPALVTDDTQMALALGEALSQAPHPYQAKSLGKAIETAFIKWYHDPENNRAPGMTCLTSIENLLMGKTWRNATSISSKGCGANMRVQAIGLLAVDAKTRAELAQFQAAITHAHPTALAASDITAWTIADLYNEGDIRTLLARAYDYALSQRSIYHADWLGDVWERALIFPTAIDFITRGWDEVLASLKKVEKSLLSSDPNTDPCLITGAGWVAEEAYATALYCFLRYPDDPQAVIERAAMSSGDSDSLACIAGSFAGVHNGFEAWPSAWESTIEYQERIYHLVNQLSMI